MPRRFHVPHSLAAAELELSGKEAHHLLNVLRMGVGDQVWVFDGRGHEALARIREHSEGTVKLDVLERREATTETRVPLILGAAVPKGERFRWMIEKLTELGIDKFVPLQTARSIVDPGTGKLEKMRQTIVEASKQCRRSKLMQLTEPTDWKNFIATEFPDRDVYVAHPAGESWNAAVPAFSRPIVLAIGPEGGFIDSEIELAYQAGAKLLDLGPRILRIETAALLLASLFGTACDSSFSAPT